MVARPGQHVFQRMAITILLLLATGCGGGRASVNGTLTTQDDLPLAGARITVRNDTTGEWATAVTDEQGHFSLGTVAEGSGLPAGEYYVVVTEDQGNWDDPRPPRIHAKYGKASTSGLRLVVAPRAGEVRFPS